MQKIKFTYLYRDSSNYKAWGEIIFSNLEKLSLEEIDLRLRKGFDTDGIFTANQVQVPEIFLFANGNITSDDHCFHEFYSVEVTEELPNDQLGRSIKVFVEQVELESKNGWRAFNPAERIHET